MKKIYLVTKSFPYTNEERSFLGSEYEYLTKEFEITLITTEVLSNTVPFETKNSKDRIICIDKQRSIIEKLRSLCYFMTEKDCWIEIGKIIRSRRKVVQQLYRALMFGSAAETFYLRLKQKLNLKSDSDMLFYFYWYDYKCFGLTMHKKQYPHIKIIARTHGYELYDERELYGRQFFKEQMDRELERLIFAAAYAKKYYLHRHHLSDGKKYPLYRLGVPTAQMTVSKRRDMFRKSPFLLLSCSHTITIKRVDLIIRALAQVEDCQITWVHLGNGEEFDITCEMAEQYLGNKNNIHYEFKGEIPNEDVVQFYKDHYVSAFITTTSTEGGSPVSVQEALSFGVPVIATAIAELPVMVSGNGILLSDNPMESEIAASIKKIYDLYGTEKYFEMCVKSLDIYEQMFNASNNYARMIAELHILADE